MSVYLRIQYTRKLFMPTKRNCSVLSKEKFDINGTTNLHAGRRPLSCFLVARGKVRNETERSRITLNVQILLDRIIIMLTISRRAKHCSNGVFDVTSQNLF